jgi:hypothetical protein
MSKIEKKYGWLNIRPNSAKTFIEKAKREVPGFAEHVRKFEHQITIKIYAPSTVFSYSRGIAQISLQNLGKNIPGWIALYPVKTDHSASNCTCYTIEY